MPLNDEVEDWGVRGELKSIKGEKMKMMDFVTYKTIFKLALDGYKAELLGTSAGVWEREMQRISGRKPVTLKKNEEKLELIKNVKAVIPHLFRDEPSAKYKAILNRHFDPLAALSKNEQATLDSEELSKRFEEFVLCLDDSDRAIVENEPQRLEFCLRYELKKLARQADGECLKILIEAVEKRIDWLQLKGEDAHLIDYDRKALDFLKEFLLGAKETSASPTKQTEEPAAARDKLFQAFDDLCKDEKKRHEIMQYLPGRQGRKKKGVQTKVEYMNDLRKEICPALSSTEYFMKRFDDWARERLSQKTDKENG